eukprot:1745129-Karenia_brevis.AAC.1
MSLISWPYGNLRRAMRGAPVNGISFNGHHCILLSLISRPYGNPRRAMRGAIVNGSSFNVPNAI